MSASNAAAKKRRALIPPNPNDTPNIGGRPYASVPPPPPQNGRAGAPVPAPASGQGLTLPQVITLIDKRLVNLEKNMADVFEKQKTAIIHSQTHTPTNTATPPVGFNEYLEEYDTRFEILTNEIAELKSVIVKLQSYTMDVNKMLLEERQSRGFSAGDADYSQEEFIMEPVNDNADTKNETNENGGNEFIAEADANLL
jgi:hypothetical protein